MRTGFEENHRERSENTLAAIREVSGYLEGIEKDLGRMSKRLLSREVAQSVGLASSGIREALNYLAIVKKVIKKTERAVAKKNSASDSATLPTGEL